MPLPNFIIIGAGKSGTTSLAHQLGLHPDIFLSDPKEPHFFSINWDKGVDWYRKIFAQVANCQAIGEASATYSLHPEYKDVPKRMESVLGKDIRLIYIVRNPVMRMISHCQHDKIAGLVPKNISYGTILNENSKYFQGSCYASQLERYLSIFGSKGIKIVVFESFVSEPKATLKDIFTFLGVDSGYNVPVTKARNMSVDNRHIPGVIRKLYGLKGLPLVGSGLRILARAFKVKSLINRVAGQKINKPELSAKEFQDYYEKFLPEIKCLSEISGIDLEAAWSSYSLSKR